MFREKGEEREQESERTGKEEELKKVSTLKEFQVHGERGN